MIVRKSPTSGERTAGIATTRSLPGIDPRALSAARLRHTTWRTGPMGREIADTEELDTGVIGCAGGAAVTFACGRRYKRVLFDPAEEVRRGVGRWGGVAERQQRQVDGAMCRGAARRIGPRPLESGQEQLHGVAHQLGVPLDGAFHQLPPRTPAKNRTEHRSDY
eukprot:651737-Prorocentrum_minimum.AAC.3